MERSTGQEEGVLWLTSDHIIEDALFADGTKEYRNPVEIKMGQVVRLKFRTARQNVDTVTLVWNQGSIPMKRESQTRYFDYYETELTVTDEWNEYYFSLVKEKEQQKEVCYYTSLGVVHHSIETIEKSPMDASQVNGKFVASAEFHTPDWAKGAVFYQIFVDRFYNGDPSNDVVDQEYLYIGSGTVEVNKWHKYPSCDGVREFYGGDLLGVIKKLDYLKDLGVEVIYLNPIFVSPSNHKYDIQDYDYVDPHFGVIVNDLNDDGNVLQKNEEAKRYIKRVTDFENLEESNRLLVRLSKEVHQRGMRIILDGVFNHCGSFHKWLDREKIYAGALGYEPGAFHEATSPYRDYFHFTQDDWPENTHYEGWWGHDTLPKLNYEDSKELYEYIMEIGKKWVSPPYCMDGWRLDVAADLGRSEEFNHKFWRDFRKAVRSANPDALILAEHYGDASSWLKGDQWDSLMNYDAFMEPVTWFLTGMEKHSDEYRGDLLGNAIQFRERMNYAMSKFQSQSLLVAMNELSNHDHSRFLTRTNKTVGRTESLGAMAADDNLDYGLFRSGVVMQFTWIGAPTIYYGDEAGVCGFTDPDNRRTYPWGNENQALIEFHKEIIQLHNNYEVLRTGSIKMLYGEQDVIAYGRFDDTDKFLIVVNTSMNEKRVCIPVWQIGILDEETVVQLLETTKEGYHRMATLHKVKNGELSITLQADSSIIIKNYVPYRGA